MVETLSDINEPRNLQKSYISILQNAFLFNQSPAKYCRQNLQQQLEDFLAAVIGRHTVKFAVMLRRQI